MRQAEVAVLIGYISQTDNRDASNPYAVQAWHDALEPWVTLEDAKAAVVNHRRTSNDYLGVNHVNAYVRQLRRQRVATCQTVPVIPADLDQVQERAWIALFWDAVKLGMLDPHTPADHALNVVRPQLPAADLTRLARIVGGAL